MLTNRNSTIRALGATGAALVLALGAGSAQAQALPTAEQVVERYVEAIGGNQAIKQHDNRKMVMEMSMPAMGMTMRMESYHARPNKTFTRMEMPGMGTMTFGYNGQVAWQNNPMQGPRIMEGAELEQTLRQSDFDANMDLFKAFPTMETVERTEMGGTPCVKVRMVAASGDTAFGCFAVDTGLLVGMQMEQVTEMGNMQATMLFQDYKDFDGIKMPTRTTVNQMGQEMVMTVKEVSHAPIDPAVFELPAEVKALRQGS